MNTPFVYGRIADKENFTDREQEVKLLTQNFNSLVNTVIISPRRWGKTSLVNKTAQLLLNSSKDYYICHVDIFNCRTEEEFYLAYANALLKVSTSAWEEFVSGVKRYLGKLAPIISLSDTSQTYELSFGITFKDNKLTYDEILDLPQAIANDSGKKIIVCIDEFQNINEYERSPLAFQRKLRAHWQKQTSVCYCLYGKQTAYVAGYF